MGGSSKSTQVEPWKPAQSGMRTGISAAQKLYNKGNISASPYTGERVVGFGDATQAAQAGLLGRAESSRIGEAYDGVMDMAGGDPYRDLDGVRDSILGSVVPAVSARFSGNGMMDSSVARDEITRAATKAIAPFEYGAHSEAQGRKLQAAGMAPMMEQARYMPDQMALGIGSSQDAMAQARRDAEVALHYEQGNESLNELQTYLGLLGGVGGMGSQQTSPGVNPVAQLAGAGASGLGAYGMLAANPATAPLAMAGGLLTGIGGLFGGN